MWEWIFIKKSKNDPEHSMLNTLWCITSLYVYKDTYPPELQLKVEDFVTHGTFWNLDTTVRDGVFIYKLFDKHDSFPSFYCLYILHW